MSTGGFVDTWRIVLLLVGGWGSGEWNDIPGQQFFDVVDGMIGEAGERVAEVALPDRGH